MGIRMTGLISNMDTDSIVKELMNAHSLKKTKIENKITKTEWTQEKWKELNTKIYALYTGSVSKLRLQGAYGTKKVVSSDESKVTVSGSSDAVTGSHSVKVNKLASAQYLTGSKITATDGSDVTGATKLVDIDSSFTATAGGEMKINFSTKDKSYFLTITEKTTVSDLVNAAKEAGITANFDNTQKRFFFSSSASGTENAYSVTTSQTTQQEFDAKNTIRNLVGYADMNSSEQANLDNIIDQYKAINKKLKEDSNLSEEEVKKYEDKLSAYQKKIDSYTQNRVASDLKKAYTDESVSASDLEKYGVRSNDVVETEAAQKYNDSLGNKEFIQADLDKAVANAIAAEGSKYAAAVKKEYTSSSPEDNPYSQAMKQMESAVASIAPTPDAIEDATSAGSVNRLEKLGLTTVKANIAADGQSVTYESAQASLVSMTESANSEIVYNGATLTGTSNTIMANGLTFDVHAVTASNETLTLTVSNDTQAVYDTIKQFVKDYNDVLKEMNTLYNASSARGYDPLTDDEKEAMTDDQIEKWETKIKDSLLRRDNTLNSLISTMKDSLIGSVTFNNKSYALSSFGIGTNVYTEKGLLHIDGDSEDSLTAGKDDKLKKALDEDPEAVMETLTTLVGNLYTNLTDKMKATSLSSALTFYNDKEITKNLKTYKDDLSNMEDRLKTLEDRYYDQFGAMESAMAKMNSQTSSLAALMGSNS